MRLAALGFLAALLAAPLAAQAAKPPGRFAVTLQKLAGKCNSVPGSVRRVAAGFRPGRDAIVFRALAPSRADVLACGLDRQQAALGGWLHLVAGRIDQDALLAGRSRRVVARAAGTPHARSAARRPSPATEKRRSAGR
jgi:hypothetical protein